MVPFLFGIIAALLILILLILLILVPALPALILLILIAVFHLKILHEMICDCAQE